MQFMGIDPGKLGGIAVVDPEGHVVTVQPTPIVDGQKGRPEYDLPGILKALCFHAGAGPSAGVFVTVEKAQPMPPKMPGGSIANFHRGVGRGWEWMLCALGIPYQLVAPVTWQKAMHAGTPGEDTKQRSILAAQRLFPGVRLQRTERCRLPSDGLAEALLLAEYGRRVHGGARG